MIGRERNVGKMYEYESQSMNHSTESRHGWNSAFMSNVVSLYGHMGLRVLCSSAAWLSRMTTGFNRCRFISQLLHSLAIWSWQVICHPFRAYSSCVYVLGGIQFFVTSWTVAHQTPLPMEFSRQKYWSRLPFATPGDLPNLGIEPGSPALQADSLPLSHQGVRLAYVTLKIPKWF